MSASNAGADLPTSARRRVFSCSRRHVAEVTQLAFDSVAPIQAHRIARCEERCEALERAVHPRSAFAAGRVASGRLWFHCRVARSASLYRRPSDKCFHRAPILPYFPCSPSVTRFGAYPAPGGTTRLCFGFTTPLRKDRASGTPDFTALRVSAFRKSFVRRTQKDFPNLPKKAPLGLGSGAHSHPTTHKSCVGDPGISRRFAQECPEGNPGKYNQGEKQWRSTKTRSL